MKTPRTPLVAALAALVLSACRAETVASVEGDTPPDADFAPLSDWRTYERPSEGELRDQLSSLAYRVTQEEGTERAFTSPLNDNKSEGLYVDIVSGEPLFSSRDKFDSGTGWPSFTRPVHGEALSRHTDYKLLVPRTEVRSAIADSHLGHVFRDGPAPTGLRYCINGAALHFVPVEELEASGYGAYAASFE